MRSPRAGLLLMMLLPLVACVHETTVFHSPTGASYFKAASTESASRPPSTATSATSAADPELSCGADDTSSPTRDR